MGQISRADLLGEQANQQRYVLESRLRQQARLQSVGYPLLRSAISFCGQDVARRTGMFFANAPSFDKEWRDAARSIGFTDTVALTQVLPGSGAERSGLKRGDRLLAIDDTPVRVGPTAVKDLSAWLAKREKAAPVEYRVTYRRDTSTETVTVPTDAACSYRLVPLQSDVLNAFADGQNVYVTTGMLRFAADDAELSTVIGHEISHNAMRHIDAQKRNMGLGMLLGAIVDVAAAANGINTEGEFTKQFGQLGAMVFSQDFEREADYVGMYVVARSGRPVSDAAELWRHMAAENPGAIKFASSHPTTAERFIRLRQFAAEIEQKQLAGAPLVPEMKSATPPTRNPGGEVLAWGARSVTSPENASVAQRTAVAPREEPTAAQPVVSAKPQVAPPQAAAAQADVMATPRAPSVDSVAPMTATGTEESDGTVLVRVFVRVPDWVVGRFTSVRDYPVLIVGPGLDSTIARTDESGTAVFTLKPGRYHIAPMRQDGVVKKQQYEWDLDFDAVKGMQPIELTEANGRRRAR